MLYVNGYWRRVHQQFFQFKNGKIVQLHGTELTTTPWRWFAWDRSLGAWVVYA